MYQPTPEHNETDMTRTVAPLTPSSESTASNDEVQFPALLSLVLPPCGLLFQVAYSNIVHRLRNDWVAHVASHTDNSHDSTSVRDICKSLRLVLRAESNAHPPGASAGTGARQPWRREEVFQFEMMWIRYFVREAETMRDFRRMSEKRRVAVKAQMEQSVVPKELSMDVTQPDVKQLWVEWQNGKRAWMAEYETSVNDAEAHAIIVKDSAESVESLPM